MKKAFFVICLLIMSGISFSQNITFTNLGSLSELAPVYPEYYYATATIGDYLYAIGDSNLYIYGISDVSEQIRWYATKNIGYATKIWSNQTYLCIYDRTSVKLYDVTQRENPQLKGSYAAVDGLNQVEVRGNYMFVLYLYNNPSGKKGSLEVVDISNPTLPVLVTSLTPENQEGHCFYITNDNETMYLAHYDFTLNHSVVREIDISDPASLQELRSFTCDGAVVKMDFIGNDLIVLKDSEFSEPAWLEAYSVPEEGDWINLASVQVTATSNAWDMHVYGYSITLTLSNEGIKDYTWNQTTNSFEAGTELVMEKACYFSWNIKQGAGGENLSKNSGNTQGTGDDQIYYYVLKNELAFSLQRGREIRVVKKELPPPVTLTMSISPDDAQAYGCSVNPGIGEHIYKKNTGVSISAIDNPDAGWVFKEWTGSVSGSNKTTNVLMDGDKTTCGNFEEISLIASGEKKKGFCSCELNNVPIQPVTITCTALGDDWTLSGLKLEASGNGDDKNHIKNVSVELDNSLIWLGIYPVDNGIETADFENILIAKGQSVTLSVTYDMQYPEDQFQNEIVNFNIKVIPLALPVHYEEGKISGSANGEIWVGLVYNTAGLSFITINDAIRDGSTKNGDVIEICPGVFNENVIVYKDLTLRSASMSTLDLANIIPPDNSENAININANDVKLYDLKIRGGKYGIFSYDLPQKSKILIENCAAESAENSNLYLLSVREIEIRNSHFYNSKTGSGIAINGCTNLTIRESFAINNKRNGLELFHSGGNINIYGNKFDGSTMGIDLSHVNGAKVWSNIIENCTDKGIDISDSKNIYVAYNKIGLYNSPDSRDGILVIDGLDIQLFDNEISNFYNGVYVLRGNKVELKQNKIYNNEVGVHAYESKNFSVEESQVYRNKKFGIELTETQTFFILNNSIYSHRSDVSFYGAGVILDEVTGRGKGYIRWNNMYNNCTAIKTEYASKNIVIQGNQINNSWCLFTGLHLYGGNAIVRNNSFSGNLGAAIMTEGNANPTVEFNNFSDNDYALYNNNESITLNADNNYFGLQGPAAENLFGNIDIPNWLSEPVSLVGSFVNDTLFAIAGGLDSLTFCVQNVETGVDSVSVTFSDELGWLAESEPFIEAFSDSAGIPVQVFLNIPRNDGAPQYNVVTATVNSFINPAKSFTDQMFIMNYVPVLNYISATHDSISITVNDSLNVTYFSFDQYGNDLEITPSYSCTNGTIDEDGLYQPQGYTGPVTITISESTSGISTLVHIYVASDMPILNSIRITPADAQVRKNSFIRLSAQGYDQYGYKLDFDPVWSCNADTITADGFFISGDELKDVTITVCDSNHNVTGQTIIHVVNEVTEISEEEVIPTSYALSQNYPNPFNPVTTIKYQLPENSLVKIRIYNILGQLVEELVNTQQYAGNYSLNWDAVKYSSGVYFCRIEAAGVKNVFYKTIKMLLIK